MARWVMSELERTPVIPAEYFQLDGVELHYELKVRRSEEDARQVWQMVTDRPLQLSLTYVATVGAGPVWAANRSVGE
jgi:hypothetical protein